MISPERPRVLLPCVPLSILVSAISLGRIGLLEGELGRLSVRLSMLAPCPPRPGRPPVRGRYRRRWFAVLTVAYCDSLVEMAHLWPSVVRCCCIIKQVCSMPSMCRGSASVRVGLSRSPKSNAIPANTEIFSPFPVYLGLINCFGREKLESPSIT